MDGSREEALRALERCVKDIPDARVRVFGSAASGFGGQTSDLDFSIEVPTARLAELFHTYEEPRALGHYHV